VADPSNAIQSAKRSGETTESGPGSIGRHVIYGLSPLYFNMLSSRSVERFVETPESGPWSMGRYMSMALFPHDITEVLSSRRSGETTESGPSSIGR
jgi:hypothetical protein